MADRDLKADEPNPTEHAAAVGVCVCAQLSAILDPVYDDPHDPESRTVTTIMNAGDAVCAVLDVSMMLRRQDSNPQCDVKVVRHCSSDFSRPYDLKLTRMRNRYNPFCCC